MRTDKKTLWLVRCALCAAMTAVLAQISFQSPSGVPLTLQTLAIAFTAYVLGARYATVSVTVYLMLGAVGLPVFSHFNGGIQALVGVTGGFLWGFIPMAFLCGLARYTGRVSVRKAVRAVLLSVLGLAILHLLGTFWYCVFTHVRPLPAFLLVSAPYLLKDLCSMGVAWAAATALARCTGKSGACILHSAML